MQLYATELMGAETYDDQGNFVGRVREFFIEPADQVQPDRAVLAVARAISTLGGAVRPGRDGSARNDPAELQRAGTGVVSAERRVARGSQRFARPTDYRHERPEGRAR